MKQPSSLLKIVGLALLSALVITALPISRVAGASCKADIEAEFRGEVEGSDRKNHVWKVDVTTPETCAKVTFTLWVREIDGNGEQSEYKQLFEIKASSREVKSRKVNHVVPMSTKVADWRFEIYSCEPCGG